MLKERFNKIREWLKDFNRLEIKHFGVTWSEGKSCPMTEAGVRCFGTLQKMDVVTTTPTGEAVRILGLVCDSRSLEHSVSMILPPKASR